MLLGWPQILKTIGMAKNIMVIGQVSVAPAVLGTLWENKCIHLTRYQWEIAYVYFY